MPPAIFPSLTIVAAFHLLAASAVAQVVEDVPVPQLIEEFALNLGLDPARDPALFVPDLARLVYARVPGDPATIAPRVRVPRTAAASSNIRVPIPLTVEFWSRTVFERSLRPEDILISITADQRAALLAHGLSGLDDQTLAYFANDRSLVRRLYDRSSAAFGTFGESVRIDRGQVQVPGGPAAVVLWEGLLEQPVTRPAQFVEALFERERGRFAYLYDLVARLDERQRAFVLGTWMDESSRAVRFAALASAISRAYPEWRTDEALLSRPVADLSMLVMRLHLQPSGAPDAPSSRSFWTAALATDDVTGGVPVPGDLTSGAPVDAAWLVEMSGAVSSLVRGDRLDQIGFVYRVFGDRSARDLPNTVVAARAFRGYRALLVAFERMGVREPATYATAARRVARLTDRDPERVFWTHAQWQGAMVLIARAAISGGVDRSTAAALVESLGALLESGAYTAGALAGWFATEFVPRLPPGDDIELRVAAAVGGRSDTPATRLEWEGERYRLNLAAAEVVRLGRVRAKQASFTLDLGLALDDVRRQVDRGRPEDLTAASARLSEIRDAFGGVINRPTPSVVAPRVEPIRDLALRLQTFMDEANALRSGSGTELRALSARIGETVDAVFGEAVLSYAYATALGDPEGTALLGRNVALRHDFGFTHPNREFRARLPLTLPVQHAQPGGAWHVTGSLLGIDLALAPLAMRRISLEPLDPPRLSPGEREAFALGVTLMDPARLRDEDRDAIVASLERGRTRLETALAAGGADFADVMDALNLEPRRRRAIAWTLAHDRTKAREAFSLGEVLALGGIAPDVDLDAWGTSALASTGCPCTAIGSTDDWRRLESRPQAGLLASASSDLNLRIAVELGAMSLPAALAQQVLAAATLDLTESVAPIDAQDWLAIARGARDVPRARIEDYIAATTAVGGALVPDAAGSAPEQ
jgi:hypothetical protein